MTGWHSNQPRRPFLKKAAADSDMFHGPDVTKIIHDGEQPSMADRCGFYYGGTAASEHQPPQLHLPARRRGEDPGQPTSLTAGTFAEIFATANDKFRAADFGRAWFFSMISYPTGHKSPAL
jgi:hypothetical protein